VSVLMYAFGFANIVTVFVFLVLTGAFIGLFNVLQPTMIADAVDAAEERTGVRNDGISFATLTFTAKVMSAFAVLVFGLVVAVAGYENGSAVTPEMQQTIWIGFTLVPAASCLLSAAAFWFYRLERTGGKSAAAAPVNPVP
jgi:Na+/melibiose symporter-like transporter